MGILANRLAPLTCAAILCACAGEELPPHVIVITMDTLRADALGCYGAGPDASPEIDRFARGATRFAEAISTAPWTVPSHASLFTGLYPFEHGAISFLVDEMVDNVTPLAPEHLTLAEALAEAGYRSAGFVANTVYLQPRYGLSQGFEEWVVARQPARDLSRQALEWLDECQAQDAKGPCLLFLNFIDTHRPYNVEALPGEEEYDPKDFPALTLDRLIDAVMVRGESGEAQARIVREQYARALRNLDLALGAFFDALRERGLFDSSLIVLTSDHGEYFGEHGLVEHSKDVYQPGLAIPLILHRPGQRVGEVRRGRASLVDVPGLIAQALPESIGSALRARFPRLPGGHALIAENHFSRPRDLLRPAYGDRFRRERTALYTAEYKYIHSSDGAHELYRLVDGEEQNLIEAKAAMAARLGEQLERAIEEGRWRGEAGRTEPMRAEERAAMRALGYLGDSDD